MLISSSRSLPRPGCKRLNLAEADLSKTPWFSAIFVGVSLAGAELTEETLHKVLLMGLMLVAVPKDVGDRPSCGLKQLRWIQQDNLLSQFLAQAALHPIRDAVAVNDMAAPS